MSGRSHALIAAGLLAALIVAGGLRREVPREHLASLEDEASAATTPPRARPADRTIVHGMSLRQFSDTGGESRLSARALHFQKRLGLQGLVVYQDARDVLVQGGSLSISLGTGERFDFPTIPAEIARILGLEESNGFGARRHLLSGLAQDAPGAFLSRVRFEDLTITLESTSGQRVALEARKGRFHPMSRTLILAGGVEIRTPEGETIQTGRTITSPDLPGLYLPMSHRRGDTHVASRTSLSLDETGVLQIQQQAGSVDEADPLDELESLIFTRYLDKLPPPLRSMLVPGMGS